MTIIKCKMCGGDIALSEDKTFGTCEYCGCSMTFPKVDSEQRAAAFNRGNHFRRIGEFDKALAVYEKIVSENEGDAEAHWCCALCRFGIEYVEDPNTMEWFPTCHRVSFDSFLEDVDYKAAVEHSEGITRRQYLKEGLKIAEVQKGILLTSQNTQPYDIFLCYKETDEEGKRTRDSLLAQEIYYQLTEQGRSVFYSRITLENVPGTAYEPYIFAALNSAKVMIVVGTKPEYLNAPWVKNEWSRFLTLMKKDRSKLLLPCYLGLDPYDLPEQLGVLQSYDMSRIGFLPDLTRGISKVLDHQPVQKETVILQQNAANADPLLRRAFLFLEDGDWKSADEYCEKVLDMIPENAEAYLGKLLAEKHIRKKELLGKGAVGFENSANYQKALRFGDDAMKTYLESAQKDTAYHTAKRKLTDTLKEQRSKAFLKEMASAFEELSGWRDADALAESCRNQLREMEEQEETRRQEKRLREERQRKDAQRKAKQVKKTMGILIPAVCAIVVAVLLVNLVIPMLRKPGKKSSTEVAISSETAVPAAETGPADPQEIAYQQAEALEAAGELGKAAIAFGKLGDYKGSRERSFGIWEKITPRETITYHMAIKNDGSVITLPESYLEPVAAWEDMVSVYSSTFYGHLISGLRSDGTVVSFSSAYNNIYNNHTVDVDTSSWKDIVSIAQGDSFIVGLCADGTVMATGFYLESEDNEYVPGAMVDLSEWNDIIMLRTGRSHVVGLKSDGTVVAAGWNEDGQCNVSQWENIVKIDACYYGTIALRADGTVAYTGAYDVSSWTDVVDVRVGSRQAVGLRKDGTVLRVGPDKENGFSYDTSSWKNIRSIEVNEYNIVGLLANGTVEVTGWDQRKQLSIVRREEIAAVRMFIWGQVIMGIKANGDLTWEGAGRYEWKSWSDVRLPNTPELPVAPHVFLTQMLDAVPDQSLAYAEAENLLAAGETAKAAIAFGKLGDYSDARQRSVALWRDITPTQSISVGNGSAAVLKEDGSVVHITAADQRQYNATNWRNVVSVSAGRSTTVGLKADGTVVSCGAHDVNHWKNMVAVDASQTNVMGLKQDGTVLAVGHQVEGLCDEWTDIVAISASSHLVGLKMDGTVVAAGSNSNGQCDVQQWTDIIAVSSDSFNSRGITIGLKSDGTVVVTGDFDWGKYDLSGWENIIAVAASVDSEDYFVAGLTADGSIMAAGSKTVKSLVGLRKQNPYVAISAGRDGLLALTSAGDLHYSDDRLFYYQPSALRPIRMTEITYPFPVENKVTISG